MRTLFVIALLCLATPALAQDDLFVPSPPPQEKPVAPPRKEVTPAPQAVSIEGIWAYDQSGGGTLCADGVLTIAKAGKSRYQGLSDTKGVKGNWSIRLDGAQMQAEASYVDIFGNPQTETWNGNLSADASSIRGTISGKSWASGCNFTMTRR